MISLDVETLTNRIKEEKKVREKEREEGAREKLTRGTF